VAALVDFGAGQGNNSSAVVQITVEYPPCSE